jgi:hypothetical protein
VALGAPFHSSASRSLDAASLQHRRPFVSCVESGVQSSRPNIASSKRKTVSMVFRAELIARSAETRTPPSRSAGGFCGKNLQAHFCVCNGTVLILVNRIRERRRSTGIVHREEGDEFIVKVVFCVLVCPVEPAPNLAGSSA